MAVSELFSGTAEDPYAHYRRLRAEGPVHWDPRLASWLLTDYVTVAAGMRDHRLTWPAEPPPDPLPEHLLPVAGDVEALYRFRRHFVVHQEGEVHDRLRRAMQRGLSARTARRLRTRLEALAASLLDRVATDGRVEVMADFALPLATASVGVVLGLPARDLEVVARWSAQGVSPWSVPGTPEEETVSSAARCVERLTDYVGHLARSRLESPRDDIVSDMARAWSRDELSLDELTANLAFVCEVGRHTTGHAVGNAVLALLAQPEILTALRDDPGCVDAAVEELLRYDVPGLTVGRVAIADFELEGHCVRAGQRVMPALGAANRDPDRFPDPDRLRLDRTGGGHVAFGSGDHYCPGAPLARVEMAAALQAVATRLPGLRLAPEGNPPEWRVDPAFRLLDRLDVVWDC